MIPWRGTFLLLTGEVGQEVVAVDVHLEGLIASLVTLLQLLR